MKINRVSGLVAAVVATAGLATTAVVVPAQANSLAPQSAPVSSIGRDWSSHHQSRIVTQWSDGWNKNRPALLGSLFTKDATYTDVAFGVTYRGPGGVSAWVQRTHAIVKNAQLKVTSSFRSGDQIAIQWTFSGHIQGAPKAFSVPASTIIKLCGEKIQANTDYYNLAEVLKQSGLPPVLPPMGN